MDWISRLSWSADRLKTVTADNKAGGGGGGGQLCELAEIFLLFRGGGCAEIK